MPKHAAKDLSSHRHKTPMPDLLKTKHGFDDLVPPGRQSFGHARVFPLTEHSFHLWKPQKQLQLATLYRCSKAGDLKNALDKEARRLYLLVT